MRKTPKEISECGNQFETQDWLLSATTDEICGFFTYSDPRNHTYQFARAALEIRLSKDAEIHTRRIVWLTRFVAILTVVLVALTGVLVVLTYKLAQHP
ncbi:MAG: hypothetical protein ABSE97_02385 [Verrucomicrobiota bacterium]|jgi:hypothetical protein